MNKSTMGSCLCGEVRFDIIGDFESFFLCHCKHCQKDTGSAHAANLFSSKAELKWSSREDKIKTYTLPLTRHTKSFCMNCGSALPSMQMEGKLLVVPVGSLDSKFSMKPSAHIFISSKAEWDKELETIERFEKLPE